MTYDGKSSGQKFLREHNLISLFTCFFFGYDDRNKIIYSGIDEIKKELLSNFSKK